MQLQKQDLQNTHINMNMLNLKDGCESKTNCVSVTRDEFMNDRQGRTFADVWDDPEQPIDELLALLNDEQRQRRMEESETHHDRPPLAGIVRELESQPGIDRFLASAHPRRTKRFRQAVGVLVRIIMEARGWQKTGRKGSLGVRAKIEPHTESAGAYHNTGGLAYWFLRAERYEPVGGRPYQTVKERVATMERDAGSVPQKVTSN